MNAARALDPRRMAVLRANALGDFIFALPALEALKRRFPAAELVYIGRAWHARFLHGRPSPVDRVLVLPDAIRTDQPLQRNAETERFLAAVRAEAFDLAFQMHGGGGYTNPLLREFHAKLSIGLQASGAPPLDVNIPYQRYMPEVLRYLEVAARAGAPPVSVVPRLQSIPSDHEALSKAIHLPERYVVLHPGATDVRRRWRPERFAAVGDHLARTGFTVCITGTNDERPAVEAVMTALRSRAVDLCNRVSLEALAALLDRASLVISNDTGPLHLSRALGTPTVGIYWLGNMITYGLVETSGNRVCVSWQASCPRCGLDILRHDAHVAVAGCDHAVSFVDQVSAGEVIRCVDELIEPIEAPDRRAASR